MNRIFKSKEFFKVPDGTLISPFLNSKDSMSGLPFDLIDGFSIAQGIIEKGSKSKIHVHPFVDQVTYVLSGNITLKMKSDEDLKPYELNLKTKQAGISRGGEFFQLVNPNDEDSHVLYIVSPAYLFEMKEGKVVYDDAIILSQDWSELEKQNWKPNELKNLLDTKRAREESFQRLKMLSK